MLVTANCVSCNYITYTYKYIINITYIILYVYDWFCSIVNRIAPSLKQSFAMNQRKLRRPKQTLKRDLPFQSMQKLLLFHSLKQVLNWYFSLTNKIVCNAVRSFFRANNLKLLRGTRTLYCLRKCLNLLINCVLFSLKDARFGLIDV